MIKLNAGFSRKVGEANYSSRGASVNVDLELESADELDPREPRRPARIRPTSRPADAPGRSTHPADP